MNNATNARERLAKVIKTELFYFMEIVLFIETMTHGIPSDKIQIFIFNCMAEPDAHAVILLAIQNLNFICLYKIVTKKWKLGGKRLDKKEH